MCLAAGARLLAATLRVGVLGVDDVARRAATSRAATAGRRCRRRPSRPTCAAGCPHVRERRTSGVGVRRRRRRRRGRQGAGDCCAPRRAERARRPSLRPLELVEPERARAAPREDQRFRASACARDRHQARSNRSTGSTPLRTIRCRRVIRDRSRTRVDTWRPRTVAAGEPRLGARVRRAGRARLTRAARGGSARHARTSRPRSSPTASASAARAWRGAKGLAAATAHSRGRDRAHLSAAQLARDRPRRPAAGPCASSRRTRRSPASVVHAVQPAQRDDGARALAVPPLVRALRWLVGSLLLVGVFALNNASLAFLLRACLTTREHSYIGLCLRAGGAIAQADPVDWASRLLLWLVRLGLVIIGDTFGRHRAVRHRALLRGRILR